MSYYHTGYMEWFPFCTSKHYYILASVGFYLGKVFEVTLKIKHIMFGLILIDNNFKRKTECQCIVGKCLIDTGRDTVSHIRHIRNMKMRPGLRIFFHFDHEILSLFLGISVRADGNISIERCVLSSFSHP